MSPNTHSQLVIFMPFGIYRNVILEFYLSNSIPLLYFLFIYLFLSREFLISHCVLSNFFHYFSLIYLLMYFPNYFGVDFSLGSQHASSHFLQRASMVCLLVIICWIAHFVDCFRVIFIYGFYSNSLFTFCLKLDGKFSRERFG